MLIPWYHSRGGNCRHLGVHSNLRGVGSRSRGLGRLLSGRGPGSAPGRMGQVTLPVSVSVQRDVQPLLGLGPRRRRVLPAHQRGRAAGNARPPPPGFPTSSALVAALRFPSLPSDEVPGAWRWASCPAPDEHPSPAEWQCRPRPVARGRWWGPGRLAARARAPGGRPDPTSFGLLSFSAPRESQLGTRHFATCMTQPGGRGTRSASQLRNRCWLVP